MKTLSALIFTLLFANQVLADSAVQISATQSPTVVKKSPLGLEFNLNIMRFNGSFGFGAIYDAFKQVSTELSYTHTNSRQDNYGINRVTADTTANAYGLRLNYYPFSDVTTGGFYATAKVSQVSLTSDITGKSFLSSNTNKKILSDEHVSHQAFLGWHFSNRQNEGVKLNSRLGLGYGNGENYGIRQGWKEFEISDSLLVDASFLFSY